MMSESQEQVRNLFNLSREEKILDDFGCSLSEKIPIPGRLYLTEHYICFGSNLFGFNRKYSIAFNEINELILKKNIIEIKSKNNKKNKFSFTSFNNIQIVYKRIKSMCRSYNETISTISSESKGKEEINPILLSDSENSDDEDDDIINNITSSSSKKNSENSNTSSNDNSPKTNNSNNIIIEKNLENTINSNSNKNLLNISNSNINIKTELSKSKTMNEINMSDTLKKDEINIVNNINSNSKSKKSISPIKNIDIEKEKNINNSSNKKENDINSFEEEEIKFNPIEENVDTEICRKIFDINPKNFFEKFQTNTYPETSYKKYYEWVGDYTEINVPDWEKIENQENPEIEKFQRIETFCLALRGVPLVNKSNVIKTLTYWIDKDGTYYIKTSSKSQGVPLSDCFLIETTLEFHPYMNNTKTVFRTYVRTKMLKSTIFKSALISQGKKSFGQEVEKWLTFIEEKDVKIEGDYIYKPKKRKNSFDKHRSLSHGIEKENSQMKKNKPIVEFSDFCGDIYDGIVKYTKLFYEYFYREFDKKTRTILIFLFLIFILLLTIINGHNNEIRELKNGFNEMKEILNNLTNLTMELKKNMGKK